MQPYEKYLIGKKERRQKEMKKVYKRLLSVLLALVMVIGMIPVSAVSTKAADTSSSVIYLHATHGTAPFKARFSGDGSITDVNMVKVADGYYRATIPASSKTTVMFVDANESWLANGNNWPTLPTDGKNCFEPAGYGANGWSWSTYSTSSESGTTTTETFMVSTELWDYFNNNRVESNGSKYSSDNEGGKTAEDNAPYSAWNYVIAGNSTNTSNCPTIPLYFGGLGHKSNRKMKDGSGNTHGLPNFSLTANVALSDIGTAAAQGIVYNQLVNGNLADTGENHFELPYFKTQNLFNDANKQVSAYYPNLQFPFKKTTSATGKVMYSYDSAEDYAVYYDYDNKKLYTSNTYSYNNTQVNGENEKGYYPFDNAKGYNPSGGKTWNATAANARNMGFGTRFTIPFTLSMDENRQINGQDVVFNFTGDDDVWVFIDDVLVLDMGGAHYKASGEINFTDMTVTVAEAYTAKSSTTWTDKSITGDTWDQASSTSVTVSKDEDSFKDIKGIFTGESETKSLEDLFPSDDTKLHTLTFFYMERGMYDSNMSISFTFNPVPSGLILSKAVNTANVNAGLASTVQTQDYFDFEIAREETADDSTTSYVPQSGITYTKEYDGAGSESGGPTSNDGLVKSLADNIYAYDFMRTNSSGSKEDAFKLGDKLQITEKNVDSNKYSTSVFVWDQTNAKMVKLLDDTYAGTTSAAFQLGEADANNPNKPGVNYAVNFTNTPYVGSVSVEKAWSTGTAPTGTKFDFKVLVDLDGDGTAYDYQPYALAYTIDSTAGTTGTDGTLQLAAGEKAVFAGIPVGAKVKAVETTPSGDGWIVDGVAEKEVTVVKDTPQDITITNKSNTGSVSLTKAWSAGTAPTDTTYEFEVSVNDVKSALAYTSDNATPDNTDDDFTDALSADGKVNLKAGETITFTGLTVGAKVKAQETATSGTGWEVDGDSSGEVTVEAGKTLTITITNKAKLTIDKVIYVEAGKTDGTDYAVTDPADSSKITVKTATLAKGTPDGELTVTVKDDGSLNVDPSKPNKTYTVEYTGEKECGSSDDSKTVNVTGKITVHTYAMTDDVYVFDYGLESDLADITYNNGMFQNDNLYIDSVNASVKFTGLNTSNLAQGTITAKVDGTAVTDVSTIALKQITTSNDTSVTKYSGAELENAKAKILYTPTSFMDQQETATYATAVYAPDNTKETIDSPEDGVEMDANITVMPASVVYYEDNFASSGTTSANGTNGIIYAGTATTVTGGKKVGEQSNSLDIQYGYDAAYAAGGAGYSNGSATKLGNTSRALFEFTGTGFDIISRTTNNTGNLVVNIYKKENVVNNNTVTASIKYDDNVPYVENAVSNLMSVLVVNTYYENGDLYQVPVISKDDLAYGTYIVEIVATFPEAYTANAVYIDGIRIYNPMGEKSTSVNSEDAYIAGEKTADVKEVRSLILGEGYQFDYDTPEKSIAGAKPSATLIKYAAGDDGIYFLEGTTVVESFSGEFVKAGNAGPDATKELLTYAVNGPNNELYLESGYAFGFDATAEANKDLVLQIGVKKVQGEQPKLKYLNEDEQWVELATVDSATELYYDLSNINDLYLDSQVILTVDGTDAILSFTNLKINRYSLSGLTPEVPETNTIAENKKLNANTIKVKSGYSYYQFVENKYSTITFKTSTDVESIKVVKTDAVLTDGQPAATDSMAVVTASYKDSDGVRSWTVKFKIAETAPNYSLVCYDMYGNYSEKVNLK